MIVTRVWEYLACPEYWPKALDIIRTVDDIPVVLPRIATGSRTQVDPFRARTIMIKRTAGKFLAMISDVVRQYQV